MGLLEFLSDFLGSGLLGAVNTYLITLFTGLGPIIDGLGSLLGGL